MAVAAGTHGDALSAPLPGIGEQSNSTTDEGRILVPAIENNTYQGLPYN